MFQLLDSALQAMLDDPALTAVFPELFNADVSFITPEKGSTPAVEAVNLFLYETRENRELRNPEPVVTVQNGLSLRRQPPLRVDCSYLVTSWSKKTGAAKVAAEHQLLGQAFSWFSRFPTIPERYLQTGGLTAQMFPPPTLVAQMDPVKTVGEFWSALGIAPRPFFNLIVTIAMDLSLGFDDPMVTSLMTTYLQRGASSAGEERIIIGGTVRDKAGNALPDAWVRLEPAGLTRVTDRSGRFLFSGVERGFGMTLRARATGKVEVTRSPVEVPSVTRDYDLQFST